VEGVDNEGRRITKEWQFSVPTPTHVVQAPPRAAPQASSSTETSTTSASSSDDNPTIDERRITPAFLKWLNQPGEEHQLLLQKICHPTATIYDCSDVFLQQPEGAEEKQPLPECEETRAKERAERERATAIEEEAAQEAERAAAEEFKREFITFQKPKRPSKRWIAPHTCSSKGPSHQRYRSAYYADCPALIRTNGKLLPPLHSQHVCCGQTFDRPNSQGKSTLPRLVCWRHAGLPVTTTIFGIQCSMESLIC
jgi:hypothetical protein